MLLLQEVTDIAWNYFLSNPLLRQKYPYISSPAALPLPNERNILFLSAFPFKAHYLPLVTAHKPALIIHFDYLVIAGVHLSAGLHEEKLALKLKELSKLASALKEFDKPFIIAGDFNVPKHSREYTASLPKLEAILSGYVDAWTEISEDNGDTFVPERNWLAKESCKTVSAQRHDRVYFERGKPMNVETVGLFGVPEDGEELGSDHWGLYVDFRINFHDAVHESVEIPALDVPSTNWKDDDLLAPLKDIIPTKTDNDEIVVAVTLLRSILEPMKQQVQLHLQIVGSVALQSHTRSGDVDILAISTISQNLFWQVFLQHLKKYKAAVPESQIKIIRIIRDAKTPMVELLVNAQKVEMQYCPVGRLLPMSPLPHSN
jgi:hypothetical protein